MMSSERVAVGPNSLGEIVAVTDLREQLASLQKQLTSKDKQLLSKEKQVGFYKLENDKILSYTKKLEQNQLRIKNLQRDLNLLKKFNQVQQQQLQNIKIEEDNAFPAAIPLPANTTPVSVDFLLADYYFCNITGHLLVHV